MVGFGFTSDWMKEKKAFVEKIKFRHSNGNCSKTKDKVP